MAPVQHAAILACLLTALGSGCLAHADAPVAVAPADAPADAPAADPAPATAAAAPTPQCPPNNFSNYGTSVQIGDTYLRSPYEGKLAVAYKESNGCDGLQTEADWPSNPDTRLVEVPYPIAPASPVAAANA